MKVKTLNREKGTVGENMALDYLEKEGLVLVERNYRNDFGEIDLIMSDRKVLVFVEVKYKTDDRRGLPEEMVTKIKLRQVRRVAEMYLRENKRIADKFLQQRIDAVCILGNKIKYYKNLIIE